MNLILLIKMQLIIIYKVIVRIGWKIVNFSKLNNLNLDLINKKLTTDLRLVNR